LCRYASGIAEFPDAALPTRAAAAAAARPSNKISTVKKKTKETRAALKLATAPPDGMQRRQFGVSQRRWNLRLE